jgi:hypothetical protein
VTTGSFGRFLPGARRKPANNVRLERPGVRTLEGDAPGVVSLARQVAQVECRSDADEDRDLVTIGSIGAVSARLPLASSRNSRYRTPWAPPPSPDTGLIMRAAPELSTTFAPTFALPPSVVTNAARTTVVRTPIGRASGDAAPAHADHAYQLNTATSGSWSNEQAPSRGALRRSSGRPEPCRGSAPAPDAARGPRWAGADGAECARSPRPLRSARSAGSARHRSLMGVVERPNTTLADSMFRTTRSNISYLYV